MLDKAKLGHYLKFNRLDLFSNSMFVFVSSLYNTICQMLCCMNNSIQYTLPNLQFHIREHIVQRYFQKHLLDHV